jgi:hypothetical protein
MDLREAQQVFERLGGPLRSPDAAELRRCWIQLARRLHASGSGETQMAEVNAAYDALKRSVVPPPHAITRGDPLVHGVCAWAWAGHRGQGAPPPSDRIAVADESDVNYVKRHLWQASGRSEEAWTLWGFDRAGFLPPLTVFGSRAIFDEMARCALHCLRQGFRRPRAVFVQKHDEAWPDLLLVYSDGQNRPAIALRHTGGYHPGRDQALVLRLPQFLDDVQRGMPQDG